MPVAELPLHGIDAIAVVAPVREHGIAAVEAGVFAGAARRDVVGRKDPEPVRLERAEDAVGADPSVHAGTSQQPFDTTAVERAAHDDVRTLLWPCTSMS